MSHTNISHKEKFILMILLTLLSTLLFGCKHTNADNSKTLINLSDKIQEEINHSGKVSSNMKDSYYAENILLPEDYLEIDSLKIQGNEKNPLFYAKTVKKPKRHLLVKNCIFDTYLYNQFGYTAFLSVINSKFSNATGTAAGQGYGLLIGHTARGEVRNCFFYNNQRHALYAGECNNLTIDGNIFYRHRYGFGTGVFLSALNVARGSKNITVLNNKFIECESLAMNISTDNLNTPTLVENIAIHDNLFYKSVGKDLKLGQSKTATDEINIKNIHIYNNTFFNEEMGCASVIVFNGENIVIENNNFTKTGNNIIVIDNTNNQLKNITIKNNTFDGNYDNAIFISKKALNGTCKINIEKNRYIGCGKSVGLEKNTCANPNVYITY